MTTLFDVAERTQLGEKIEEKQWDIEFYKNISELVKEYDIRVPQQESYINMDDELPERAFAAAVEFLERMGVYCITTRRKVQLSRDEILTAIHEAPTEVIMGEGRDRRIWKKREIEEKGQLNICPGHHTPFTEDLAGLVVSNFARIQRADFIEGFNFSEVDGKKIIGAPMEVYASRRQIAWMREGVRKAGKPGMAIVYYPINTRAEDLIGIIDPDSGLRKTDGILLTLLPDLKMEQDMLSAAIVHQEYGSFKLSGSFSIVGGFCGGIEGAIIEGIAKPLACMIVYHDFIHYTGVEHVHMLNGRQMLVPHINWARSVVNQALNRYSNTICMRWVIPTSGIGTELNLLECAMMSIEAPINGMNLYAPRHCRTLTNRGQTPLEAEWMIEVWDAVIEQGIDRQGADEIMARLAKEFEGKKPVEGYTITECYDLVNHRPLPEFEKVYLTAKQKINDLGLAIR